MYVWYTDTYICYSRNSITFFPYNDVHLHTMVLSTDWIYQSLGAQESDLNGRRFGEAQQNLVRNSFG